VYCSHEFTTVEVTNAAGRVFVVMTQTQFRQHVYGDGDLSNEEMLAAASLSLGLDLL